MSAIPGDLDTESQPPMTVPLRHFVVGLGFLLVGVAVGVGRAVDAVPGLGTLAHVHLLLAGWVCITIMGAMTQFVPVWSGATLHSRRLASVQLVLVTVGLAGFTLALVLGEVGWLARFGALLLAGFWTFVYNVGRTLATVERYDVTERHFLVSLCFFLLLTTLGLALAISLARPVLPASVSHGGLRGAHATLAVFGAVLTTIYGALYQLGTMFTRTELRGVDHYLRGVEELGHPAGVALLATGRLVDGVALARVGGLLVCVAALSFALVLGRRLYEMRVERTPMHSRYAVAVAALTAWALLSLPTWFDRPTAREHLLGAPGTVHLLVLGAVGFVVVGTLYHVVPFIVWVHRYSDLLGFEDVPMIDDLYDDRLAAVEFALLVAGTAVLVGSDLAAGGTLVTAAGGVLVGLGVVCFVASVLLILRDHGPHSLDRVVLGPLSPRRAGADDEEPSAAE